MPNENESKCRINCDRFCRVWRFCSTKFKLLYQIDSGADLLPYLIFISHDRFGTWLERRLNRAFKCWASRIYHVNESQQPLKVSCQGYTWPFGYTRTRTFLLLIHLFMKASLFITSFVLFCNTVSSCKVLFDKKMWVKATNCLFYGYHYVKRRNVSTAWYKNLVT